MTTYRLIYRTEGTCPAARTRTLYFRSLRRINRYGGVDWVVTEADNPCAPPTEWRTEKGIAAYLDKYPHLRETFEIEKVKVGGE